MPLEIIQSYRAFAKDHKKRKIQLTKSRFDATHSEDIVINQETPESNALVKNCSNVMHMVGVQDQLEAVSKTLESNVGVENGFVDVDSIISEIQPPRQPMKPQTQPASDSLTEENTDTDNNHNLADVCSQTKNRPSASTTEGMGTGEGLANENCVMLNIPPAEPMTATLADPLEYLSSPHRDLMDEESTGMGRDEGFAGLKSTTSEVQPSVLITGFNDQTANAFGGVDSTKTEPRLTIKLPARNKRYGDNDSMAEGNRGLSKEESIVGVDSITSETQPDVNSKVGNDGPLAGVSSAKMGVPQFIIKLPARKKKGRPSYHVLIIILE